MLTLYTLEDHIMKAWSVADELETIRWMLMDREAKASDDEIDNAILGVHVLLNARLELLLNAYSKVCKEHYDSVNNKKTTKSTLSEYIDSVLEKEEINDIYNEDNSRD